MRADKIEFKNSKNYRSNENYKITLSLSQSSVFENDDESPTVFNLQHN